MFDFFKRGDMKKEDQPRERKKDKVFIFTLVFLAGFVLFSIVTGVRSGTFRKMHCEFRFHFTDGAVLAVLAVIWLIDRIRKGRSGGK